VRGRGPGRCAQEADRLALRFGGGRADDCSVKSATRWCPACGKSWSGRRATCPECLADLVDDPKATTKCRHCGKVWPARMQSCPNCLAELHPDPAAASDALAAVLVA